MLGALAGGVLGLLGGAFLSVVLTATDPIAAIADSVVSITWIAAVIGLSLGVITGSLALVVSAAIARVVTGEVGRRTGASAAGFIVFLVVSTVAGLVVGPLAPVPGLALGVLAGLLAWWLTPAGTDLRTRRRPPRRRF